MLPSPEQFDFSTLADQERFAQLPSEDREAMIDDQHEGALVENEKWLMDRAEKLTNFSRSFVSIDDDRHSRKYNELYDLQREGSLVKEFVPARLSGKLKLDAQAVKTLENQALGMALVTSSQILDKKPREQWLRDDSDSLGQVIRQLSKAKGLLDEVRENRPDEMAALAKKILMRRGMKEEAITNREIDGLAQSIVEAKKLLVKKARILQDYSSG